MIKFKFILFKLNLLHNQFHKSAKERDEILRGAFIANIGNNYTPDQLVFLDESAKDE